MSLPVLSALCGFPPGVLVSPLKTGSYRLILLSVLLIMELVHKHLQWQVTAPNVYVLYGNTKARYCVCMYKEG